MLSRHRSLFFESLPAGWDGFTRGYASLLNTHFHVLRAGCWCSSAAHIPSARCACRALSPELDCSGGCLAKRLHEPCFHEHCTNSTHVKLLITRSIKLNNVRSLSDLTKILLNPCGVTLLQALFLQYHFVLVYHSANASSGTSTAT